MTRLASEAVRLLQKLHLYQAKDLRQLERAVLRASVSPPEFLENEGADDESFCSRHDRHECDRIGASRHEPVDFASRTVSRGLWPRLRPRVLRPRLLRRRLSPERGRRSRSLSGLLRRRIRVRGVRLRPSGLCLLVSGLLRRVLPGLLRRVLRRTERLAELRL